MKPLTFGSVFTGIGGFDLGLEWAGLICKWQIEIDAFARRILSLRWPDVPKHDDARTFIESGIASPVDLLVAGDPCQGNSIAGSVWDRETEDLGSTLLAIIDHIRPTYILRENPTRSRPNAKWPWYRMRNEIRARGYAILPFRLRSCCVGLDHQRDRLFLLAAVPDANGDGLQRIDRERVQAGHPARTARDRGRHPGRNDLSAPRICRGADGIPHRVDRLKSLGNAVPPPVAELIGRIIIESIRELES